MEGRSEVVMDRQVFLALASLILAGGSEKKAGGAIEADDTKANEQGSGPSPPPQGDSAAEPEDVVRRDAADDRVDSPPEVVTPDTQQR